MDSIIEYRSDLAPLNDYPRRIISPLSPSGCCMNQMRRIGRSGFDGNWRFFYKRCAICGYTVRCFYAPSLMAIFEAARQIRLTLAEMNLGTGKRKRRTQAEIDAEIAAASGSPSRPSELHRRPLPL
jgi:hypothetical protein